MRPEVTHWLLHQGRCLACGALCKASLPAEHASGYGPRLTAYVGEMAGMVGASRSAVQDLCASVLGIPLSKGAMQKLVDRASAAIVPHYNRDRIIQALEAGTATQRAIAERFCVSTAFVEKLWQRWRRSGSSAAKPHAGGCQGRLKDHLEFLRSEVAKQPDATLADLRDRLVAAQGPAVSTATICRTLQRLQLPLKKSRFMPPNGTRSGSRHSAPPSQRRSKPSTSTA
jgi:transposase